MTFKTHMTLSDTNENVLKNLSTALFDTIKTDCRGYQAPKLTKNIQVLKTSCLLHSSLMKSYDSCVKKQTQI